MTNNQMCQVSIDIDGPSDVLAKAIVAMSGSEDHYIQLENPVFYDQSWTEEERLSSYKNLGKLVFEQKSIVKDGNEIQIIGTPYIRVSDKFGKSVIDGKMSNNVDDDGASYAFQTMWGNIDQLHIMTKNLSINIPNLKCELSFMPFVCMEFLYYHCKFYNGILEYEETRVPFEVLT